MLRKIQKIIAVMLIVVMTIPLTGYVSGSNGTGPGGRGGMDSLGYIIEIITDNNPNKRKNVVEYLQDNWIEGGPMDFSKLSTSLLIKRKDKHPLVSKNILLNNKNEVSFKAAKEVNKGTRGSLKPFILDELIKEYETKGEISDQAYVRIRDAASNTNYNSFVSIFGDTTTTASELNKYVDDVEKKYASQGKKGYGKIAYLDVLSMINKLTNYTYTRIIYSYLQNWNNEETEAYTYIRCRTVGSTLSSGGKQYWYTPYTFYAEWFGISPLMLQAVGGKRPHYPSSVDTYRAMDIKDLQLAVKGKVGRSGYKNNSSIWSNHAINDRGQAWRSKSQYNWRYSLMPTDVNNKQTGSSGYTFLTALGPDLPIDDVPEPNFTVHLQAFPKGDPSPGEDDTAQATMEVSMTAGNDESVEDVKKMMKDNPGTQHYVTLTFYNELLTPGVNVGTTILDNISSIPGGQKMDERTIRIPITTANLDTVFSGKPYSLIDSEIKMPNEGAQIRYKVKMNVVLAEGSTRSRRFDATPLGMDVDEPYAMDTASWVGMPKKYKYDSNLSPSFVEIKENTPGDEDFEAMAGVPTTRDLYVGFGGQEFDVQIEAEYQKEKATRTVTVVASGLSTGEGEPCPSTGIPCPTHPIYDDEGNHTGDEVHGGAECGGGTCLSHPEYYVQHPGSYTGTYTTTIPIEEYGFMNIMAANAWHIEQAELKGNPDLLEDPNVTISPDLKYGYMVDQDGYESGNGRLGFEFNFEAGPSWGDIVKTHDLGTGVTKSLNSATHGIFSGHKGFKDKVTVFSDMVVMDTSQGPQPILYDQYDSIQVTDAGGTGYTSQALSYGNSGGSQSYGVTQGSAKFNKVPTGDQIWGNKYSAKRLSKDDMVTSGYNGNFGVPYNKWDHKKYPTTEDPLQDKWWRTNGHPNSEVTYDKPREVKLGFDNLELTETGLNIIDSTDSNMEWSASDSIEPVHNGEWDTGETEMWYKQFIKYKITSGTIPGERFDNNPSYSEDHNEVNDIVVHNPVSAQYATHLTNPEVWDMRTQESLADGKDPAPNEPNYCPGEGVCMVGHLNCTTPFQEHDNTCYSITQGSVQHSRINDVHTHVSSCYRPTGYYITHGSGCTYKGRTHYSTNRDTCTECGHSCGGDIRPAGNGGALDCDKILNTHTCTPLCKPTTNKVLNCVKEHHYEKGKPYNPLDPKYHLPMPSSNCWDPCLNDKRHNSVVDIIINGEPAKPGDIMINLDKEFQVYYPSLGDFEQSPRMHGISETSPIRGMGYEDRMDTSEWTREKYVTYPVNVIDAHGNAHRAGEPINLLKLPDVGDVYDFHAVLGNSEFSNAETTFLAIANNAEEVDYYDESVDLTNKYRVDYKYGARHTGTKYQVIDVVGFLGNLTINDTGDFRFATLFKQSKKNGKWLVENLVPEVDNSKPNYTVSDNITILQDGVSKDTKYHSTYGVTDAFVGGKAFPYVSLPLTPKDNPIPALRKQPMRPGYNLYMDVETVGNYYGENFVDVNEGDEDAGSDYRPIDTDTHHKIQISPKYYELNLDTGEYRPLDVYMGYDGNYKLVISHNDLDKTTEWLYYLNWMEESVRRNYTQKEKDTSYSVVEHYSENRMITPVRLPMAIPDALGSAGRLFLHDINRTFIGSTQTYGQDMNPGNRFDVELFKRQSQRNHFTIGLPSSSVFVLAGEAPTTANMEEISGNNSVIVGTMDIKARGEVWTLEYEGKQVNYSDLPDNPGPTPGEPGVPPNDNGTPENGGGIQVYPGAKIYPPPPKTGKVEPPVYVIYDNKNTSQDDLRTEGSH